MAAETLSETSKSYLGLAAQWPPHVPRDDDDYDAGVAVIYALSGRSELGETLDEGEEMYLEAVAEMLHIFDVKQGHFDFTPTREASLGERLEEMMNDYDVGLDRLAEVAGIGRGEMDEVMGGRSVLSAESAKRLAAEYGCDEDFLL